MTRIEIRGRTFEVERLGLDEAFDGLELVEAIFGAARVPASKVPRLLRMFAKVAKVARTLDGRFDDPSAQRVALEPFLDDVFRGELQLAFDFVGRCVELEYGSFLDGLPGAAAAKTALTPPAKT